MTPPADPVPALQALVEAAVRHLKTLTWCKVCDRSWLAQSSETHAEACPLPAAREALEHLSAEHTRAVLLSAGWKETIRQLELAQVRVAQLHEALAWYGERAQALRRYLEAKPPKVQAMTAVVTELGLDGGKRAALEGRDE